MNLVGLDTIDNLAALIAAGSAEMNEEQAIDLIDQRRVEEKISTTDIQLEVIEALEEQGFLKRSLGMSTKIRKSLEKVENADSIETLQNIGQVSNPMQSE